MSCVLISFKLSLTGQKEQALPDLVLGRSDNTTPEMKDL